MSRDQQFGLIMLATPPALGVVVYVAFRWPWVFAVPLIAAWIIVSLKLIFGGMTL